ncbi:24745_t:CDS:2, partial [Cetraspora pellucida]
GFAFAIINMRKNLKGSVPFEFIYSEAESSSEEELIEKPIPYSRVSYPDNNNAGIYFMSSEECVNSDQSVTSNPSYFSVESDNSDPSYFSVESDNSTIGSVGSPESSESSQIDLGRDEVSLGQDFDDFQSAPQSEDNDIYKSLPNGLTNNKFSTLSTIYDKFYFDDVNLTEIGNSDLFYCTNPGCHKAFACEEDLRNHLLSQYNPVMNRSATYQQQSEVNTDPKQQCHSNMVNIEANELNSYERLESSKYRRNDRKKDSYHEQQSKINFWAKNNRRNNHINNLNITRPLICDKPQHEYFASGSYSNRFNFRNHSKPSQDNDNRHLNFGRQKYKHYFSYKNVMRNHLNHFKPTIHDEQRRGRKEFTTRHINRSDLTRYIHETHGYEQKFRAKKELKNQATIFSQKEISLVSYKCKEHRFKQRFKCKIDRSIPLIKNHSHICKVYNERFMQDVSLVLANASGFSAKQTNVVAAPLKITDPIIDSIWNPTMNDRNTISGVNPPPTL